MARIARSSSSSVTGSVRRQCCLDLLACLLAPLSRYLCQRLPRPRRLIHTLCEVFWRCKREREGGITEPFFHFSLSLSSRFTHPLILGIMTDGLSLSLSHF